MQRLEDEDLLDSLGWLIGMLAAIGFLFGAVVYFCHWIGWLS